MSPPLPPTDWETRIQAERELAHSHLLCPANPRIVGLDEVGRGALAGPVIAVAARINPQTFPEKYRDLLRDSKQLSARKRRQMYAVLRQHADYAACAVSVNDIDRINILRASLLAMQQAYTRLGRCPDDFLLIDGNQIPSFEIPHHTVTCQTVIGGDDRCPTIAAASIIAKVLRDRLMRCLSQQYPTYGWHKNAGYGTQAHRNAIATSGITPWHRRSFKLK